ncbi:dienelactone hydrolase family protein [Mycolicibacter arupensis]|uniref:Dienelactone hydrolase family protein n=1 Tax=Mycolicibacter arupensis TaxID=342002 RepID=A0A5B1MHE4_9MYCO|nr:dienelactone hydrolase family protein [Mycolicibacter arupensis]KAA1432191.1 dienelactone hydrolase family protein [Mycolicibacter arupensis]TXI56970.1 MAG: dienelactone hydrolase family protein [Mycolicibacter arupensis]
MTIIRLEAPAGPLDALLEVPDGPGPWPGVVLIHDAIGYGRDMQAISERVASAGYLALSPNLYSRGGRARCITRVFRDLLTQRGRALEDILAARDQLLGMPECSGAVGIAGFCMGGQFALILSSRGFGAAAPFYGVPLPRHLEQTLDGACPIVASFGGRDLMGKGAADRLRQVVEGKDIEHDIKVYPGAGHSFANQLPAQPLIRIAGFGYDEAATADAWERVFAFFGEHLSTVS